MRPTYSAFRTLALVAVDEDPEVSTSCVWWRVESLSTDLDLEVEGSAIVRRPQWHQCRDLAQTFRMSDEVDEKEDLNRLKQLLGQGRHA